MKIDALRARGREQVRLRERHARAVLVLNTLVDRLHQLMGIALNIHRMAFEFDSSALTWLPEREDLAIEFMRLLGAAQEGGSTVAECRVTAGRIDFSDDHSWYREWKRVADANYERGNVARDQGRALTAKSNWLRAIGYYQSAAFPFDRDQENYRVAIESMRKCTREYLQHCIPCGEIALIPWPGGSYPLEAYFLPAAASDSKKPAPAIICMGEPGRCKEEYLYKVARYARERGMSLVAVDLLGAGEHADGAFDEIVGRSDLEMTIGYVMDYLFERDDVDHDRIAILADGWGSSFVARGIAFDDRFAAAVCDGGIWDLHEHAFLMGRAVPRDGECIHLSLSRVARNIKCPVLISAGERGWLKSYRVKELYACLKAGGRDATLKIFTNEETAALQGHADNPTLANEFIFDWVASRLGINAR
jgi:dienelactone hydrolase